jgi:hypothetical protein
MDVPAWKGWGESVHCSDTGNPTLHSHELRQQEGLTSLSALTVQTPYDTPSIPANKIAVFAFQFDGLVHQPPIINV